MPRYIDADALKKDLTRFYDNEVTARELIDEQPTADAQPVKHGRWIGEGFLKIYCSNCSKTPDGWPIPMQTDYCPNCGAKMDGDSE